MIYDIFYISDGTIDIDKWNVFHSRFPVARKLENVKSYSDIKSKAFTKFFWVVWEDLEIVDDFKFEYRIPAWDEQYIHVFKNGSYYNGICLFSKNAAVSDREFKNRFFVNKKEIDILASNYATVDYDIIFISYQEPNADSLYDDLKMRFPRAKRVHGVKGIHQAHIEAAKLSDTDMFWVVDGDAIIEPTFNFEFNDAEKFTVYVWSSINPINRLKYGYGGVKLLPKKLVLSMDTTTTDMTTSISTKLVVMKQVSNITAFNVDEFSTWRSAFRECVKLSSKVIDKHYDVESDIRLKVWCRTGKDEPFGSYCIGGAIAGYKYGTSNIGSSVALAQINDFDWLRDEYDIWLSTLPGNNPETKLLTNQKGDQIKIIDGKIQSVYLDSAERVLTALNEVSPSFCLAKWFNVSIHIPTGQTHSCYHPRTHKIPLEEVAIDVSALHNTKYKKLQRQKMIEGDRPTECSFCWEIEDSGTNISDRAYRSKDVYRPGIIEEAIALGADGNPAPRYLEVNFNQACNFRCTYCSPHLSTAWMQDIERNGPYQLTDKKHNDITWMQNKNVVPDNSATNPYLIAFWKWLPQIYFNLQTFRMTGGEPLMDKNTFKVFEYIKSNPKKDLHLSITSNCCPPGDQWNKFLVSLKEVTDVNAIDHFMLFCSLDSWGPQAEYIRDGLNFEILYKNVTEYLSNSNKHSLTFIITFNVLSYPRFLEYLKNILLLRQTYNTDRQLIWFDIPQLTSPAWMDPRIAPDMILILEEAISYMKQYHETPETRFKGFKDFEISKVQRLLDWVNSSTFDREPALRDFALYWDEHDRRRGTNFVNMFPELENLYNESKNGS